MAESLKSIKVQCYPHSPYHFKELSSAVFKSFSSHSCLRRTVRKVPTQCRSDVSYHFRSNGALKRSPSIPSADHSRASSQSHMCLHSLHPTSVLLSNLQTLSYPNNIIPVSSAMLRVLLQLECVVKL